jgi:hypothetical protein
MLMHRLPLNGVAKVNFNINLLKPSGNFTYHQV